ncbi:hypothetical protein Leryth_019517 [Lithospermum erythrorhizon]|nr:hypothetical protein Leryth_019517 [Lithospermum erythrorhizon]
MNKSQNSYYGYALCLLASILLNIFLISNIYLHDANGGLAASTTTLTWTVNAAVEAEAVASISCSGHGRAYLDGVLKNGNPVCECDSCFSGSNCSQFDHNCVADATSGDPLFLEPFWEEHAASSALITPGWHRMSYSFPNANSLVSQELEDHIRKLHSAVKNANTEGRYLIVGVGSTQLLNAAVYALSMANTSSTSKVVASSPYYPVYRDQTNFFETAHYEFRGDALSLLKNTTSDSLDNVIEFVASPNNPDGKLKKAVLQGPFVKTIYDHAYYWPHFSAIPAPVDEDIMLFTLSKLTGHAGTRLGWAFVKSEKIYELMSYYIGYGEMSVSKDTQLRALKLLKVILAEGNGRDIFDFGYETMKGRWEKLSEIVSLSNRFTLQEIPPQYCTFYEKIQGPSPAYAWLRCEREEDADCYTVLEAAKIIGRKGNRYGVDDRYIRLSLLKRDVDFEVLLQRMKELVLMDVGAKASM